MNILKSKITKVLFLLSLLAGNAFAYDYFKESIFFNADRTLFFYEKFNECSSPSVIYDAYSKYPELIELGITSGKIDVNKVYSKDGTLLMYLAERGNENDIKFMKFLIKNGADVNLGIKGPFGSDTKNFYYETPLYEAIDFCRTEAAICLLEAGASADFVNHYYNTSLMHALYRNQKEVAYEIIKNNSISIKALNYWSEYGNETALMMAIYMKMYDFAEELVKYGADVNIETKTRSALKLACQNKNEKLIKILLDKGANPNSKNPNITPLLEVIEDIDLVKLLVENGANVNGKEAPLVYAAENKDTAVLEYLISKGAKIESKDPYGNTALLKAIGYWNIDAILLLEKHNANWKAVNKNGENAFYALSYGDFLDDVKVDDNGKLVDVFTELKGKNIMEYLISKGVDINKKDKEDGYTPLMNFIASTSNKSSKEKYVVENFLKYGAAPNIKDNYGYTALFDSVDRSEIVKILLKYGANPKAKVDGETPLEYAKSMLKRYPSKSAELNKTIEILSELENE